MGVSNMGMLGGTASQIALEVPRVTSNAHTQDDDLLLVAMHKRGDPQAFNILFKRYHRRIYALCHHILGNSEDAEDACQETFVKAHKGLNSFRGDSRFLTWLTRIAVNVCRSETRRFWRKRVTSLDDPTIHTPIELEPNVHAQVSHQVEKEEVRQVLAQLPERFRTVLVLRHFQEMSYDEIAETMGWSLAQTKATIFRARQAFKEKYAACLKDGTDA
jgi:RNA polymerase sigma-70 factor (ECF subfamily)